MELLPDLVTAVTTSPWLLAIVLAVCVIDGFFPPVPSETTVVAALAATIAAGGAPMWGIAIVVAAAAGAIVGDSIAFSIGRRVGIDRFAWMRTRRVRLTTGWIAGRLRTTPATLVLVGRYIPVGRVAVNAMAGASGLAYGRFVALSAVAGTLWACMCLAIATVAATWLGDPIWSAVLAIGIMLALGLVLDLIARRRMRVAA